MIDLSKPFCRSRDSSVPDLHQILNHSVPILDYLSQHIRQPLSKEDVRHTHKLLENCWDNLKYVERRLGEFEDSFGTNTVTNPAPVTTAKVRIATGRPKETLRVHDGLSAGSFQAAYRVSKGRLLPPKRGKQKKDAMENKTEKLLPTEEPVVGGQQSPTMASGQEEMAYTHKAAEAAVERMDEAMATPDDQSSGNFRRTTPAPTLRQRTTSVAPPGYQQPAMSTKNYDRIVEAANRLLQMRSVEGHDVSATRPKTGRWKAADFF